MYLPVLHIIYSVSLSIFGSTKALKHMYTSQKLATSLQTKPNFWHFIASKVVVI